MITLRDLVTLTIDLEHYHRQSFDQPLQQCWASYIGPKFIRSCVMVVSDSISPLLRMPGGGNVSWHEGTLAPPRIRLNLCILRPTGVHNPNGKSIASAVLAQLTAESRPTYTLQWPPLSTRIAPSHGGIWTPWIGSLAHPSPEPKRHLDRFSRFAGLTDDEKVNAVSRRGLMTSYEI